MFATFNGSSLFPCARHAQLEMCYIYNWTCLAISANRLNFYELTFYLLFADNTGSGNGNVNGDGNIGNYNGGENGNRNKGSGNGNANGLTNIGNRNGGYNGNGNK